MDKLSNWHGSTVVRLFPVNMDSVTRLDILQIAKKFVKTPNRRFFDNSLLKSGNTDAAQTSALTAARARKHALGSPSQPIRRLAHNQARSLSQSEAKREGLIKLLPSDWLRERAWLTICLLIG